MPHSSSEVLQELEHDMSSSMLNFNTVMGDFAVPSDVQLRLLRSFSEGVTRARRYWVAAMIYDLYKMPADQREAYLAKEVSSGNLGRTSDETDLPLFPE